MKKAVQKMTRIKSALIFASLLVAVPALANSKRPAPSNPMWSSGYRWSCETSGRIICERNGECASENATSKMVLDYENNRMEIQGQSVRIKRHYQQTVKDSPLQGEVKVELIDNRALWLTPVDGSATYSKAWVGSFVEPKGGVVLMVSQAAYCVPDNS